MKRLSIVGAGWAGLAAAVQAIQAGWDVQLFEAATNAGGRARRLKQNFAGHPLDNGQHVLIGAYRNTIGLMRTVGLNPDQLLQRIPLDVRFADGQGLRLPDWSAPVNLIFGVARARSWTYQDKLSLFHAAWRWQRSKFQCDPTWTVNTLCQSSHLSTRVVTQLIEPLCLSALNTRINQASACVFLRVLNDALFDGPGSADLLIPRVDLGALVPDACLHWLREHGATVHLGHRISRADLTHLRRSSNSILLACPAREASRLSADLSPQWASQCADLEHTAIGTIYMYCKDAEFNGLSRPMMGLHSHATAPAQFVFDKGRLNGQHGLLAAVASACDLTRDELARLVHHQICEQIGLRHLDVVQTIVEKRATLACTPWINRPDAQIAPDVWACGDYIKGPYPSTLEGAVQSGQQVVTQLSQMPYGHRLA